jgi:hypothetical protein
MSQIGYRPAGWAVVSTESEDDPTTVEGSFSDELPYHTKVYCPIHWPVLRRAMDSSLDPVEERPSAG